MALEVGAQTVAQHVDTEIVDNAGKLVHLLGAKKLRLVDKYPFFQAFGVKHLDEHLIHVAFRINPAAPALDAYARAYH